ncbi:2319_t:CDS:2, partial [Funneliformis caledonium]
MAEAFIGLSVHVEHTNGSSIEGTVSHIDSHTQLLTLKNVNINSNGRFQQLPIYGVAGTDIKDLTIIASTSTANIQQQRHVQSSVNTFENGKSPSISTTPAPNNVVNQVLAIQTSSTMSPFSDPAIISYSQVPTTFQQSNPLSSPYGISRATSPYVNLQQLVQNPTKISQTASTVDSDSKGDEEETNGYGENSKHTVNGNHIHGDSSGIESDAAVYSHKKHSRRKKNPNSNGQYQDFRAPISP